MRVTYDSEVDAAYLNLTGESRAAGQAAIQSDLIATPHGHGSIILDFDDQRRLLGIEVLGARSVLPPAVFELTQNP